MNKKIKYIIIPLIIILIITIAVIIVTKYNESKETIVPVEEPENTSKENVMVIGINTENTTNQEEQKQVEDNNNQKEEPKTEPEPEPGPEPESTRDASVLTQEIYNMNTTIGKLYIPKTKLNTQVYCNPDPKKMEKMPAFLYTSGGINQVGITLFVGHNRRNGKMFSNNKKLSVGDIFYFTDYEGNEKKYTIYSKFTTTSDDTSFLNTNVEVPTIALSCCTDASDENRIIILGRAD